MNRFEFNEDDLFINRLKTYPEFNLFIYQGVTYINNKGPSTATISSDPNPNTGGLTIFDINQNYANLVGPFIEPNARKDVFKSQLYQPNISEYVGNNYFTSYYASRISGSGKLTVYPVIGSGNITTGYSAEVPVTRKLVCPITAETITYYNVTSSTIETQSIATPTLINTTSSALQNLARKYTNLSHHFIFSPQTVEESTFLSSNLGGRDLVTGSECINFIFIPQVYYGSTIKKGTVFLDYYITGSKVASCSDINHNGTLIGTTGSTAGDVVGLVMYDEGIIMLTSSLAVMSEDHHNILYDGSNPLTSSWQYYGTTLNDGIEESSTLASASYGLSFKGTDYVHSMTMFAHANKGHLNHSNNPTYRDLSYSRSYETGSGISYYESESDIKNIVSASYTSASFEKTTYISGINLYDENYNLIGVTRLSKPVKKTLERSYTFKLKLDI